jgi:SSS family solute:Na+ symporter
VVALGTPIIGGLLAAGVLAAILGGMDAQFLSLSSMFTHDVVDFHRRTPLTDRQRVTLGRVFVFLVVAASLVLAITLKQTKPIFGLAVWCFSGFAALFPLVIAALYWKRATKWGAYASVLTGIGTGIYFYVNAGLKSELRFASRMEPLVYGVVPAAPMVVFATVALIVVSWITRPTSAEKLERFFPTDMNRA